MATTKAAVSAASKGRAHKVATEATTEATTKATKKTVVKKAPTKTASKTAGRAASKAAPPQAVPPKAPRKTAQSIKPAVRKTATRQSDPIAEPKTPAKALSAGKTKTLRGRSVFLVQTTTAGVTVRTAWLSEDKKLMEMPAVFPDVDYALNLLDDLRTQVLKHFSKAAQVGVKAMAQQDTGQAG